MTMKNDNPFLLSNPNLDVPTAKTEQVTDLGRREWIKMIGKKTQYTAPTLFAIVLAPDAFAQLGSPPPKPLGPSTR